MYQIKLEQFEGPLDLLLQLIEKEEMDITKISLAQLADEFIGYLGQQKISSEELADFLSVAAKLLFLKSQTLFPELGLEPEEGASLEAQLKIYKEYWEAAKQVREILAVKRWAFFKEKMSVEAAFRPPPGLKPVDLTRVFEEVVKAAEASAQNFQTVKIKIISLEERMNKLKDLVLEKISFSFNHLVKSHNKAEKIVHFLAVLELIKQQIVKIQQKALFAEIIVEKNNEVVPSLKVREG